MSVPCLMDPGKPVEIPDELEAFFNVLVYDGVQFMQHNLTLTEVHNFLLSYFDGSEPTDDGDICGPVKRESIRHARLESGSKRLCFGVGGHHVINKLISEMLGLFQARLKVFEWDRHQLVTSTSKKLQDNQIGRPPQSVQDAILEEVE